MLVPIDPKLGKQGHREIHHLGGFGDNDRLAFEAPEPVALPTVIPFDIVRGRFTLHQLVLRDDRRICSPLICAIQLHIPLGEALDHLLQGRLVTLTTFPVQELTGIRIQLGGTRGGSREGNVTSRECPPDARGGRLWTRSAHAGAASVRETAAACNRRRMQGRMYSRSG
jgi:hypothetical protein